MGLSKQFLGNVSHGDTSNPAFSLSVYSYSLSKGVKLPALFNGPVSATFNLDFNTMFNYVKDVVFPVYMENADLVRKSTDQLPTDLCRNVHNLLSLLKMQHEKA